MLLRFVSHTSPRTTIPGQVISPRRNWLSQYWGLYSDALLPDMVQPDLVGPARRSVPFVPDLPFGPLRLVVLTAPDPLAAQIGQSGKETSRIK